MVNFYTGVGSRTVPPDKIQQIITLATILDKDGWVLRSGGADGADAAFEKGSTNKEIFLPWRGFNNNSSPLFPPSPIAHNLTKIYHPFYNRLSTPTKSLHARNVHQVLGWTITLDPVSLLVICWTPDGIEDGTKTTRLTGGTGQALRIATAHNIPIFNLKKEDAFQRVVDFISKVM